MISDSIRLLIKLLIIMPDETYEQLLKKALEKAKTNTAGGRFEMPKAETIVQGAQTIIRNFSQIAAALRRDEK
ncbi:MAG: hypothetical protein KKB25_01525, partial [Nanoarchaeota archaeon]|nr:hypothetical protein [Nanoarchaeota archaeon]